MSHQRRLPRWPSIHWRLAERYVAGDPATRQSLDAQFEGLNLFLGTYLGEFLGEFSFSAFFLLTGWALLRSHATSRGIAVAGILPTQPA